jgi:hypothetical protein
LRRLNAGAFLWLCGGVNLDGAVGLVSGVAEGFQRTHCAFWRSRHTDGASVMNDLVGIVDPLVARQNLDEVLLDLLWSFFFGEFQSA